MTAAVYIVPDEIVRLDVLARRLYGREDAGRLETLLRANPGLAAGGPFVSQGRHLAVPVIEAAPTVLATVNPWE